MYLKHDGSEGMVVDHPYNDVEDRADATHWKHFEHAQYVAFWYADTHRKWRIINTETGEKFVKHERLSIKYVPEREG